MNIMNNIRIAGVMAALVFSFALLQPSYANSAGTVGTWAFSGMVTEVNQNTIEMFGTNANGVEQRPKFDITSWTKVKGGVLLLNASDDVGWNVKNERRRGSAVAVWATTSGKALVIQNNAPLGQGDYYGQVDCSHCGK